MEFNLKKLLPIGLIVLAVMFIMKMMKGKRCEGFTQQKPQKVACNCNISDNSGIENYKNIHEWAAARAKHRKANKGTEFYSKARCKKNKRM